MKYSIAHLLFLIVFFFTPCKFNPVDTSTKDLSKAVKSEIKAAKIKNRTIDQTSQTAMTKAALKFLDGLSKKLKSDAMLPFEHSDRETWTFVPQSHRNGARIGHMTSTQQQLAFELLKTGLSGQGYLLAREIMELENVLAITENQSAESDYRNPTKYFISVFGIPSDSEPWAWTFEGHHLSLNYSSVSGQVSVTPAFVGANPAEVRINHPRKGWRILGDREDAGRDFMLSLNNDQQKIALISEAAYSEIITGSSSVAEIESFEGLAYSKMTGLQQQDFIRLIRLHMNLVTSQFAHEKWKKIQEEGLEKIYFAWAGGLKKNQKHYYRIHTPSTIIEYDNAQNEGNHAHIVWRDLDNDFGRDLLKEHHKNHSH